MDRRLFIGALPAVALPVSAKAMRSASTARTAHNADLNKLRDGVYVVKTPVSGPPGPLDEVLVENIITDDLHVQHLSLIDETALVSANWQRVQRRGGPWSEWAPLGGWVSPEHCGARGDGTHDDSDAFEAAMHTGFPILLQGTYRLTRQVRSVQGQSLLIQGTGGQHVILDAVDAGLSWSAGEIIPYQHAQFIARDFTITGRRIDHAAAALSLSGSGGSGSTAVTFHMENIRVEGETNETGCLNGFRLSNMRNGVMINCSHQGRRAGPLVGRGLYCEGAGDPVDFSIVGCNFYFCDRAIELSGSHEGITVDKLTAVAVNYGLYSDLDETIPDGEDNGKPLIKLTNSHINFRRAGVTLKDTRDFYIGQNDFLFDADEYEATAIQIEARSKSSLYGHIGPNKIDGSNYKGRRSVGVATRGHRRGALQIIMDAQRYVLLDVGLRLGDNTRSLTYSAADIFAGVKRPIEKSHYNVDNIRMTAPLVSG